MMKYHVNARNEIKPCGATKRRCRYQHFDTYRDATVYLMDQTSSDAVQGDVSSAPILLPPVNVPAPTIYAIYPEHVFEFYDDPYYPDDPGSVLGTDIESIDKEQVLAFFHSGVTPDDVTYREAVENSGLLADKDSFIVNRSWGYYDEIETDVMLKTEIHQQLLDFYYTLPNAVDTDGVLQYVRGKGVPTQGLTPVEALKQQLKLENGGKSHRKVDNATSVTRQNLEFRKIRIPAPNHLQEVEPRPLNGNLSLKDSIAGVVYKEPDGSYTLVDGYHRMKHMLNSSRVRKYASFYVLS